MPQSGWESIGSDDLGGLNGNCELCGTELRYIFAIVHPQWDAMAVGTNCCDRLTETAEASEFHDARIKVRNKRARFVSSKRWRVTKRDGFWIDQKGFTVLITPSNGRFRISIDDAKGKIEYETLFDAKLKAFELIESGEATAYLKERRRKMRERAGSSQRRHSTVSC